MGYLKLAPSDIQKVAGKKRKGHLMFKKVAPSTEVSVQMVLCRKTELRSLMSMANKREKGKSEVWEKVRWSGVMTRQHDDYRGSPLDSRCLIPLSTCIVTREGLPNNLQRPLGDRITLSRNYLIYTEHWQPMLINLPSRGKNGLVTLPIRVATLSSRERPKTIKSSGVGMFGITSGLWKARTLAVNSISYLVVFKILQMFFLTPTPPWKYLE